MATLRSTVPPMTAADSVTLRELHEHTTEIMRRVESGEHLKVIADDGTVIGELTPPVKWTPKSVFLARYEEAKKDPVDDRFLSDIRELLPDTVEDLDEDLKRMGWE
jgi:antitoxin (DNA-binding transcriptional repressor) of toxin-antitoxin stability system